MASPYASMSLGESFESGLVKKSPRLIFWSFVAVIVYAVVISIVAFLPSKDAAPTFNVNLAQPPAAQSTSTPQQFQRLKQKYTPMVCPNAGLIGSNNLGCAYDSQAQVNEALASQPKKAGVALATKAVGVGVSQAKFS